MFLILLSLGLFGGVLSGLLGLGGSVIMIPLILTVPPLFGQKALTMSEVAGLSMVQVLGSSISGLIVHKKNNFVHTRSLVVIGITMAVSSLTGSLLSKKIDSFYLLLTFGIVLVFSIIILIVNEKRNKGEEVDQYEFHAVPSIIIGLLVGLFSGMVGAGGGFILLPIMIIFLKMPTKIAIGTSLGIVFIGSVMGTAGKMITGQVDYYLALALVLGSIPGAQIGSRLSKKLPSKVLRYFLILILIFSISQIWYKILVK